MGTIYNRYSLSVFSILAVLNHFVLAGSDLPIMRFDLKEGEPLLSLLHELCNMGGAMRTVMTRALTDPVLYQNHTDGMYTNSHIQGCSQTNFSRGQ